MSDVTAFQTIGPFFQVMLRSEHRGSDTLVAETTRGERITIEGTLYDGAGAPVSDALVEIWQADADGRYRHPEDARASDADPAFRGFGRVSTGEDGRFRFATVRPGRVPGPSNQSQAPHVLVSILARGVLTRYITRLYFEDEASNAEDPILQLVPAGRRATLIARRAGDGKYNLDIHIQGSRETVFFDA